jgi:hypothetical protein
MHQRLDLAARPSPVVGREREQREHLDAELARRFDDALDGVRAGAMAGGAIEAALRAPAPVAVHHDRDVARPGRFGDL